MLLTGSQIGPSQAGRVEAPLWSYKLGLDNGWIPRDPRDSVGKCAAVGVSTPVQGTFDAFRTGAVPSPTVSAAYSARYPWPPTSIPSADVPVSLLPTFTHTAAAVTLPVPTYTSAPALATADLDGWFNNDDRTGGIVTVAGCPYPNVYTATFVTAPTAACTGS
jgi:glucan 1,3-beta-glucosidase